MKTRFKVNVLEEDIERASRNDSLRCVVVQAIARTLPEASGIQVDTQTIRFRVGDKRYQYLTPPAAAQYVVDFDAGDVIHPFNFQLRDPREVQVQHRTPEGYLIQAENRRRRKAARETVDNSGEMSTKPEYLSEAGTRTAPGVKPTRLVFGSSGRRMYGQRVLRYNRDRAQGFVVDTEGEMRVTE